MSTMTSATKVPTPRRLRTRAVMRSSPAARLIGLVRGSDMGYAFAHLSIKTPVYAALRDGVLGSTTYSPGDMGLV